MTAFTEAQIRELRRRLGIGVQPGRVMTGSSITVHRHPPADIDGVAATLAGDQVFNASVTAEQVHANVGITTDGTVTIEEIELDATLATSTRSIQLPDADGMLIVDAPSDGKYYVRKDGAWVEIIP